MYESMYRKNSETGKYIIDIALDGYYDFFHEWDNTSFRKRDIHPELVEFLDLCSEDIPLKKDIEIHFCVANEDKNEEMEKLILKSYDNYYNFFCRIKKKKIKGNFYSSIALAIIALMLILANAILEKKLPNELWYEVPVKGVYIGGYVFFWEALYNGYFGSKELITQKKEIARLGRAKLFFKYNKC
ncbi:hypothetical protein [Anaerovorax odorimutans]|uniref:hypothetical protein n=1 Tax=Anaerovorax odorimutans TaxID=109327 RepID=UPI00040A8B6F|nr:hypothetical protein [Anaerovorax odorimutans]